MICPCCHANGAVIVHNQEGTWIKCPSCQRRVLRGNWRCPACGNSEGIPRVRLPGWIEITCVACGTTDTYREPAKVEAI